MVKVAPIEMRYGMSIRNVVGSLYGDHGSLQAVADELGISRVTLYRYLGKEEIAMLMAQAGVQRNAEQREISVG